MRLYREDQEEELLVACFEVAAEVALWDRNGHLTKHSNLFDKIMYHVK